MRLFWMLTGISFTVSSGDHKRLERIIGDPKSPPTSLRNGIRGLALSALRGV
jgi:hypothetical protein